MKLQLALAGVLAFGAAAVAADDKKDDKAAKLVGTWEVTKGESLPPGSIAEFTKDGKLKLTVKDGDKVVLSAEGTYKIDGDSLTVKLKDPNGKDHEETMKVKSLTDKELVTFDDNKKTDTFKKTK
jgi:uncharacterized protein (TIGR03066 family)